MIVFVYRRRTVRELILTGGKVNGKHKGAVLVHGYVDLANQRTWLSFHKIKSIRDFAFPL
jgi:hypothetical protein